MNDVIESAYDALRATTGVYEAIKLTAEQFNLSVRDVMLVLGMDVEG